MLTLFNGQEYDPLFLILHCSAVCLPITLLQDPSYALLQVLQKNVLSTTSISTLPQQPPLHQSTMAKHGRYTYLLRFVSVRVTSHLFRPFICPFAPSPPLIPTVFKTIVATQSSMALISGTLLSRVAHCPTRRPLPIHISQRKP